MSGAEVGNFPVPSGEDSFGEWLADNVCKVVTMKSNTRLQLVNAAGESFWPKKLHQYRKAGYLAEKFSPGLVSVSMAREAGYSAKEATKLRAQPDSQGWVVLKTPETEVKELYEAGYTMKEVCEAKGYS